jgi:gluconolactonase
LQDPLNYESEKIAEHLRFVDGLAWSHMGFLAIADVRQRKIFKVGTETHPPVLRENNGGVSGLAYDVQGRLYMCESEDRRVTRFDLKGKIETVADGFQGKKFNAPNDIVVRKDGHVYFTDPAFGSANDGRELDFYGIWHVSPKGDLDVFAKWQTRPNGITLSPDGRVLFVTDSDRHAVVGFDLDRNGAGTNQRDVVKNIAGVPGGIKTDMDGRLYVAATGVATYSPQGRLERTLLEGQRATNCAFGETSLESLFIAAASDLFRVKLGIKGALQY